jgi:hypothetical protein
MICRATVEYANKRLASRESLQMMTLFSTPKKRQKSRRPRGSTAVPIATVEEE